MRHIIVVRHSAIAHHDLNQHRNECPAVGTIAHHLKIDILRPAEGIQDQQLVGCHGQQHHCDHDSHQTGRQNRHQPSGAKLVRGTVEIHLVQVADHGMSGMDHLLGRAGRAAGIGAEQWPVNIARRGDLAMEALAQLQKDIPVQRLGTVGGLFRIILVNGGADMLRSCGIAGAVIRRNGHNAAGLRVPAEGVQLLLRHIVVSKNHFGFALSNSLYILLQRVIPA